MAIQVINAQTLLDALRALHGARSLRSSSLCDPGREAVAMEAGVTAIAWPDYLHHGLA